ncbi:leishmanolysin, GP63 [Novymonas esmeraldas]|uniref:Leishmanolysin-like peptidase n=1 Tax=Novymonas esmeraldas TaxID=1808958 RepID=A0AAW0EXE0_9TRYP
MSRDSSSTHRGRGAASRLVRLAAAACLAVAAVHAAVAAAHGGGTPDVPAHRCIHDRIQDRVLQSVAQQHHAPDTISAVGLPYVAAVSSTLGRTADTLADSAASQFVRSSDWGDLRIMISAEDLTDPAYHCAAVGQVIDNRDGDNVTCTADDILTDEKRDILVNYLMPQSLKMHTDRLKVRQVQGSWKVTDALKYCSDFKIPAAHYTVGVSNTDMVLYVTSVPSETGVLAWAAVCSVFSDEHPAVGVMNIPSAYIVSRYDQDMISTVTHEMAHAIGYSGSFFRGAGILQQVTGIRGKTTRVFVLNSTTVVAKTREQFGCDTAEYIEIEDAGGSGSAGSHLKMRNAKDDLMAPASAGGYYTALSMAVFHDMGFYQADFSKAEEMPWGRNAGCAFLTGKCMENNITRWPDMFCNTTARGLRCPTDRFTLGSCAIVTRAAALPSYFRYFATPFVSGPSAFFDYCPFVRGSYAGACNQESAAASAAYRNFNVFSDASRCIDGSFKPHVPNADVTSYSGMCANVKCDTANKAYSIHVYGNTSGYVSCTPGQRIALATISDAFQDGGYITCPPYIEVCQGNVKAAIDFAAGTTTTTTTTTAEPIPTPVQSSSSSSNDIHDGKHEESATRLVWMARLAVVADVTKVLLAMVVAVGVCTVVVDFFLGVGEWW